MIPTPTLYSMEFCSGKKKKFFPLKFRIFWTSEYNDLLHHLLTILCYRTVFLVTLYSFEQ